MPFVTGAKPSATFIGSPQKDRSECLAHETIDVKVDTGIDRHQEMSDRCDGLHPVRETAAGPFDGVYQQLQVDELVKVDQKPVSYKRDMTLQAGAMNHFIAKPVTCKRV